MFRQLAFVLLLVAASPAIAVGYVLLVVKGVFLARRSGVSGTAMNPLWTRWLLERAGNRPDPSAAEIIRRLPTVSRSGLSLVRAGRLHREALARCVEHPRLRPGRAHFRAVGRGQLLPAAGRGRDDAPCRGSVGARQRGRVRLLCESDGDPAPARLDE